MNADGPLPWWASSGPVDGGVDPDQDPLEAHRAARRGHPPGDDAGADDVPYGAHEPGADTDGEEDPRRTQDHATGHADDICGVCPICVTARLLGETRPELLAHLGEAARHLAAAARVLLEPETSGDDAHPRHERPADGPRATRIDLD